MNRVSYSKCKKCNKAMEVSKLKKSEDGVGKICVDSESCKERTHNNNLNKGKWYEK